MKLNDSFSQLKLNQGDITENISEAKIKFDTMYKKHFPFQEQILLSRNKPQRSNHRSIETKLATLREKSKSLCSYHLNKNILCIYNASAIQPIREKDYKYKTMNLLSPINQSSSSLFKQPLQKSTVNIILNNNSNNNLILSPLATSRSLKHLNNNSNPLPNTNSSKSLLLSFSSFSNKCNEQLDKSKTSLQRIQHILMRIEKSKKHEQKEKQKALNKRLLFIYPKERNTKFRFVSEDLTNIMIQSESIERIGEVGSYANRDIVRKNYQVKVNRDDVFNYPRDNANDLNQIRRKSILITRKKLLNHTNEWINKLNSSMRKFDELHYKLYTTTTMAINSIDNNNNSNVNPNPKITINS